jgi:hypothetical protein
MNRSRKAIFPLLLVASAIPGTAQSSDPIQELMTCARTTDRDARLACYDDLGERVLRAEASGTASAREGATASTATDTDEQSLPSDLGFPKHEEKLDTYSGKVMSCQKGRFGDWYFIFDNGQIWKDVGNSWYHFKDCNFDVTITDDSIGYKMTIDSLDRTLRVKRHQ